MLNGVGMERNGKNFYFLQKILTDKKYHVTYFA